MDCLEQITGIRYGETNSRKAIAILRRICKQEAIESTSKDNSPHGRMLSLEVDGKGNRKSTFIVDFLKLEDKSPSSLLKFCGYDPAQWELLNHLIKYYGVYSCQDGTMDLHSLSIKMKPTQNIVSSSFLRELYIDLKPHKLPTYEYEQGNLLLEIVAYDFHLGKLAWAEESGTDYDLEIAEKIYKETIIDIVAKVKALKLKIEKIIYPIDNDFYHVDNEKGETTKGTRQDMSVRAKKMVRKGHEISIWALELLRSIAPVECPYVPSNHDNMLGWNLAEWLDAYYRETDSVSIDTSCSPRKYREYGITAIGLAHGDEVSKKSIEDAMADEAPEIWGRTTNRVFHLAHKHQAEVWEVSGLKLERFPAMCPVGQWASRKALSATRSGTGILYSKEYGEEFRITHNIS